MARSTTDHDLQLIGDHYRDTLVPFLAGYGFTYAFTHSRPRGVVVEFRNAEHRLFAAADGDVLYVDLIIEVPSKEYVRVSLNQCMWYKNVRSLVGSGSCMEQMDVFVQNVGKLCAQLLLCKSIDFDERYCYRMSEKELEKYVAFQTGIERER